MPNFVEIAPTAAEIWRFCDFSRCRTPPGWIFKTSNFNRRKGQEGQSASVCQISSKSFELWPIFRLLNMDFEKVGMIRIRLLFRTIRQDHVHFGFRSMCERGEIRRCYRRSGWVWRWCSGVARKRQTKVAMDILCVKKEAKLSARVIPGVEEGNGEEDLRCKS